MSQVLRRNRRRKTFEKIKKMVKFALDVKATHLSCPRHVGQRAIMSLCAAMHLAPSHA